MASEQATGTETGASSDSSPLIAALLSFFIPGVGQYYAGDSNRGLVVFGITFIYYALSFVLVIVGIGLLMLLVAPIIHIVAAADAYLQSNE
jgi:uncharacterized membrane protein